MAQTEGLVFSFILKHTRTIHIGLRLVDSSSFEAEFRNTKVGAHLELGAVGTLTSLERNSEKLLSGFERTALLIGNGGQLETKSRDLLFVGDGARLCYFNQLMTELLKLKVEYTRNLHHFSGHWRFKTIDDCLYELARHNHATRFEPHYYNYIMTVFPLYNARKASYARQLKRGRTSFNQRNDGNHVEALCELIREERIKERQEPEA